MWRRLIERERARAFQLSAATPFLDILDAVRLL